MLITEHSIPNTRNATPGHSVQHHTPGQTAPQPTLELRPIGAKLLKLISKAGDRQSWMLLALVMIPMIGMIRNFMIYGFER